MQPNFKVSRKKNSFQNKGPECLPWGLSGGFSCCAQLQRVQYSDSLEEEGLPESDCAAADA